MQFIGVATISLALLFDGISGSYQEAVLHPAYVVSFIYLSLSLFLSFSFFFSFFPFLSLSLSFFLFPS